MASIVPAQQAIAETLDQLARDLGLSDAELASALGVMPDDLNAWRSGSAAPTGCASQRLDQLVALHQHLVETFDSPGVIPAYLRSKLRYLGGDTPVAALLAGRIDRVEGALEALDSGIFI